VLLDLFIQFVQSFVISPRRRRIVQAPEEPPKRSHRRSSAVSL